MWRLLCEIYGLFLLALSSLPLAADDIDIYSAPAASGPKRIMLALDLREGTAHTVCADAAAPDCARHLGAELHAQLDLFAYHYAPDGSVAVVRQSDGALDREQPDPRNGAQSIADTYWPGTQVDWYDTLRAALRDVLTRLAAHLRQRRAEQPVEVGLMATHAADCPGAGPRYLPDYSANPVIACSRGAYVLQGFTDIRDPAGLDRLLLKIAALPTPGRMLPWMANPWRGHPYSIGDLYLELLRYISGQGVFNGFLGASDYGSRSVGNLYHDGSGAVTNDVLLTPPGGASSRPLLAPDSGILVTASFDLAADRVQDAVYIGPAGVASSCSPVAMVNFLFGTPAPTHPDTRAALAAPVSAGGLGLQLAGGEAGDRSLVAALAAGRGGLPQVRSYFLVAAVDDTASALAVAGGTDRPLVLEGPQAMLSALEAILQPAQGPGASLVTAAVPIGQASRRQWAEDIYFNLFQPGGGAAWRGNIKKLKLVSLAGAGASQGSADAGNIIVQAPLGRPPVPAISSEDGQILADALTFWTDPAGPDVLAFDPALGEVPGRDGRSVDRGGAGQQVPGFLSRAPGVMNSEPGARQLFTLDPSAGTELLALDAVPATVDALGSALDPSDAMTGEEKLALLGWIRGLDSFDADGDGDRLEARSWLLADAVHSRPLAVSYGARSGTGYSQDNPDTRVFFGTNDGLFHMLRNTNASAANQESGRETWAFVPPSLLAMQHDLALGRPGPGGGHHYGLDGEAVAYIHDRDHDGNIEIAAGDGVWVYIGQRRGGDRLFAFDMSDADQPRFMWQLSSASPGFEQLALTFSTPRVARLDIDGGALTPVLIFGGGYNGGWTGGGRTGKDAGNAADTRGNAVFVVDAATGALIWKAVGPAAGPVPRATDDLYFVPDLLDSIASPLTVIDADNNGAEDRAYVGDTGGNVWRLDMTEYRRLADNADGTATGYWRFRRLASLGGSGQSDRRFFHAPDVLQSRDGAGDYEGVVILSGNRAAPRSSDVANFAYFLKDRETVGAAAPAEPALITQAQLEDIIGDCVTAAAVPCGTGQQSLGWKLALQAPGEKGLSTPLVTNGSVLFSTYVPAAPEGQQLCAVPHGYGRVYAVALADGASRIPPAAKLNLEENPDETPEETSEESRKPYVEIGPGLHGDVIPYRGSVLIPGGGMAEEKALVPLGRSTWRVYWRQEGIDSP